AVGYVSQASHSGGTRAATHFSDAYGTPPTQETSYQESSPHMPDHSEDYTITELKSSGQMNSIDYQDAASTSASFTDDPYSNYDSNQFYSP
ncbi:hypothetical protein PFISCL1PPCAC_10755, partial [Pristionchus fissidentatus]